MKAKALIFAAVALVMCAAGCKKESTPSVTPSLKVSGLTDNTITVTNEGGSVTFTVEANVDWSATSSADWVSASPASTKISDGKTTTTTVTVKIDESKDGKARSAELSVGADNVNLAPVKITVKQTEKIDIIFESDLLIWATDSDARTEEFSITANKSWAFKSIDADWISVEPTSKDITLGTKTVTKVAVSVTKNEASEDRSATLIVQCEGAEDIEILVKQDAGNNTIAIYDSNYEKEITEVSYTYAGGSTKVVVDTDSNTAPEVSSSAEWLSFTADEFTSGEFWNGSIVATVNSSAQEREGTLTFKVKGNEKVITVKQDKGVSVELSVDNITYQTADLTVKPSAETFTYYTTLLTDEYYQKLVGAGYSDADILYGIAQGNAEYYEMDLATYLGYVLKMGEREINYVNLDPATKFTAVCGGMNSDGTITTECKTISFSTTEKPAADASYSEYLGTWKVKGNSATYNKTTGGFDYGKDDIEWTATVEEDFINESYYFSFQNKDEKVSPVYNQYYDRYTAGYVPSDGSKAGFNWLLWTLGDLGYTWSFQGTSESCGMIWAGFDTTTLEGLENDGILFTWDEEKQALVPTNPAAGSFVITTYVMTASGEGLGYYSGYAQITSMTKVASESQASKSSVKNATRSIPSTDEIKALAPKAKFNCVEKCFANKSLKVRNAR